MKNPHLTQLMKKDMTRKEFLAIFGLGLVSILGFGHIVHFFTGKSLQGTANIQPSHSPDRYGS